MAEIKISQLPPAANTLPADFFLVVQNGINKKISQTELLKTLDSTDNIRVNPARRPINFQVSSANISSLLFVNGVTDYVGINTDSPEARFHVNGNVKVGNDTTDGIVIHGNETLTYTSTLDLPQGVGWFKPINASKDCTNLIVDVGVSSAQFELTNGTVGQYKTVTFVDGPIGTVCVIKILGGVGFNRVNLVDKGQSLTLKCVDIGGFPKWVCVGSYLANLFTV